MFNQLDTLSCNELIIFKIIIKDMKLLEMLFLTEKAQLLNQKNYCTLQIQNKLKPMKMFI